MRGRLGTPRRQVVRAALRALQRRRAHQHRAHQHRVRLALALALVVHDRRRGAGSRHWWPSVRAEGSLSFWSLGVGAASRGVTRLSLAGRSAPFFWLPRIYVNCSTTLRKEFSSGSGFRLGLDDLVTGQDGSRGYNACIRDAATLCMRAATRRVLGRSSPRLA